MEEWDDDDTNTEEDCDGFQEEAHTNLPYIVGGQNVAGLMGQYEAEFPPLQNNDAANKGKWALDKPQGKHQECWEHKDYPTKSSTS